MFNIGPSEMFMLGILFLFLFGPEKLPEVARSFAQALAAFREHSRTVTDELKRQLEAETSVTRDLVRMQEPERELDPFYKDSPPAASVPMGIEVTAPAVGEAGPLPVVAEELKLPALITDTPAVPALISETPAVPAVIAQTPAVPAVVAESALHSEVAAAAPAVEPVAQAHSLGDGFIAPSELQGVKRQRWSITASQDNA